MDTNLIILIAVVVIALGFYSIYVGVIKKKNKVQEAFSSISV